MNSTISTSGRRSQLNPPTRGGALRKLVNIALRGAELQRKSQHVNPDIIEQIGQTRRAERKNV
jgi:hypothetical protein